MNNNTKNISLISAGIINILHALFHIIQFIQSVVLTKQALKLQEEVAAHSEDVIERIMHHPAMPLSFLIVGILSMYIGYTDYKHHKRCGK